MSDLSTPPAHIRRAYEGQVVALLNGTVVASGSPFDVYRQLRSRGITGAVIHDLRRLR